MPEQGGEKTLPASPAKRAKARERGNVAKSQDLNSAWTLLVSLILMRMFGGRIFDYWFAATRHFLQDAHALLVEPQTMRALSIDALGYMFGAMAPILLVLMVAGAAINIAQVGFLFAVEAITPKLEKINPITGLSRFVSVRSAVELIKSILKLTIIGYIVWLTLAARFGQVLTLMYLTPVAMIEEVAGIVGLVWFRIVVAMIVLSILDYAFQRWQYERDLMMTVQEAKDELRELEGDPRIRQRIRQVQRQVAMQRMMAEVPAADVIITNPVRYAVALRYDPAQMQAPIVVAKGARLLAERIRDLAVRHDVPIVEKPALARLLYRGVEVGHPISEDLFRAVAEVLAFVYAIDRREEKARERAGLRPAGQPA